MTENLLNGAPLFYPSAREWMWDYCVYLGPFTSSEGQNFDLGIFIGDGSRISAAIVYGNEPGNYISGDFRPNIDDMPEWYQETYDRAKILNLIP